MSQLFEKAVIEIEENHMDEVEEKEVKSSVSAAGGLSGFLGITNRLKSAASQMAGQALGGILSGLEGGDSTEKKQYVVQFNPTELQISASGKETRPKTGVDAKRKNIAYGPLGVCVEVTIPLIFDKSETDVQTIKKAVKNKSITSASVAPEVENFLKSIKNPDCRNIRFSWGNMMYEGQLSQVNAQYTMFSGQGNPIRASVMLTLLCKDKEGGKYWEQKYNESFKEDEII